MRCVVLDTPTCAPRPSDSWSWGVFTDNYGEAEALLKGYRSGLKVFNSDEL
jgi:hypothetical protein